VWSKLSFLILLACMWITGSDGPKLDYDKAENAFMIDTVRWPSSERPVGTKVDRVVVHSSFAKEKKSPEWFDKKAIFAVWRAQKDSKDKPFISVHYFIDRAGKVYQLVPEAEIANHAKGYNTRSIGIELAGIADDFVDEARKAGATDKDCAYTDEQYVALNGLLTSIKSRHDTIKAIRHSDIYEKNDAGEYFRRKGDPGALFDEKKIKCKVEWTTSHKGE